MVYIYIYIYIYNNTNNNNRIEFISDNKDTYMYTMCP